MQGLRENVEVVALSRQAGVLSVQLLSWIMEPRLQCVQQPSGGGSSLMVPPTVSSTTVPPPFEERNGASSGAGMVVWSPAHLPKLHGNTVQSRSFGEFSAEQFD